MIRCACSLRCTASKCHRLVVRCSSWAASMVRVVSGTTDSPWIGMKRKSHTVPSSKHLCPTCWVYTSTIQPCMLRKVAMAGGAAISTLTWSKTMQVRVFLRMSELGKTRGQCWQSTTSQQSLTTTMASTPRIPVSGKCCLTLMIVDMEDAGLAPTVLLACIHELVVSKIGQKGCGWTFLLVELCCLLGQHNQHYAKCLEEVRCLMTGTSMTALSWALTMPGWDAEGCQAEGTSAVSEVSREVPCTTSVFPLMVVQA
mmetsp:Transcript_43164/g.99478  ORF Transcript_43164/g.99478 Transcript_43164/m.99478 type:complete len:256 (-) Transcript_43164:34-801(-)